MDAARTVRRPARPRLFEAMGLGAPPDTPAEQFAA